MSITDPLVSQKLFETGKPLKSQLIHEMVEKQAIFSPDKIGVVSSDTKMNYADIDVASNQVANLLIKKGIKSNDVVGICVERSISLLTYVLGILKAGAAYLPLDPSFPKDRLQYMLSDSGASILIAEDEFIGYYTADSSVLILGNEIKNELLNQSKIKPESRVNTDSLAYLIYTSGSTGLPKGVRVHHKAVVNFLESMAEKPGFTSEDKLLAITTLSFDISVLEIFLPLVKGGTLIIEQQNKLVSAEQISDLIDKHDITVLQATPATWNILVYSGWKGKRNLKVLCGGEAISTTLISELLPRVKELWNMYGPTETTVWSTCYQLTSAEPPVLVGKPINNTSIHILSPENNILPEGSIGEVCIGGLGVTLGYHNRPELTSKVFIKSINGGIIYKTGDSGKIGSDGQLEIFGRLDNQIKLRGFRIEPGEIEVCLNQLIGIKESVVKVQKFSEMDERLVAFLNTNETYILNTENIIRELKQKLPSYMIPAHYVAVSNFPRTPNGKIDKKTLTFKLSDIQENGIQEAKESIGEKEIGVLVKHAWTDILKINNIGEEDNFFEIGGNSLLLIQLVSLVNQAVGEKIGIITYLEYPTIKSFSLFLIEKNKEGIESVEEKRKTNRLKDFGNRRNRRVK